jgi:hypothetical protein
MQPDPTRSLRELEDIQNRFGSAEVTQRKIALLEILARRRLRSAAAVLRLHEVLCFLRAYPDSRALLRVVEKMLQAFATRSDLQRFRDALGNTGVAGTAITYPFFWPMARWLAHTQAGFLQLDWEGFAKQDNLLEWLPQLVTAPEAGALDELDLSCREWIERLRGEHTTDATFVVRRIEALPASAGVREAIHDVFDLHYRLDPGHTASRTHAYHKLPVTLQKGALQRGRPELQQAIREAPRRVRFCPEREGQQLVDLAREAMLTRSRDLDVFSYGNPRDVRLVDFGDGLQFACIGFVPERRLLLHSLYGFLTLKNGVPIGYVLASCLFGCAGVAYNTFETYRGAEAGVVFGRVLAMAHALFGARSFSIDPYQLGLGNTEGLKSGAWWFYYKLGFRPLDADVKRELQGELRSMKARPTYRSSIATLEKLAAADVYYHLDERDWGTAPPPMEALSLSVSRILARESGVDREQGLAACAQRAQDLLGLRDLKSWSRTERQAWMQWGVLICALHGVQAWRLEEKRAAINVIRAKGGRRESDFVRLFDAHTRLRRAVQRLGEVEWEAL